MTFKQWYEENKDLLENGSRTIYEIASIAYEAGDANAQTKVMRDTVEDTKRIKEDLDCLCAQLSEGVRENEDGTFHMVWTQTEIDVAKKRAHKLRKLLQ